jgi:hypothetical protein
MNGETSGRMETENDTANNSLHVTPRTDEKESDCDHLCPVTCCRQTDGSILTELAEINHVLFGITLHNMSLYHLSTAV